MPAQDLKWADARRILAVEMYEQGHDVECPQSLQSLQELKLRSSVDDKIVNSVKKYLLLHNYLAIL